VLADGSAPKAHALALYLRAFAHISQNQGPDWQLARTDLEQLLAQHPTEDIAAKAQAQLASMTRVWPGAKAPDFRGTDQDGQAFTLLDYQGFVCVIDFGSAMGGLSPAEIKSRRELIAAYEGRPFRWIGGLLEPATQATFREKYAAAGVNWRCALLGTRQSDIAALWSVMMTPAVFVVDAQGVIRARNLPWDEQRKLIEQLVAERESAGPKR
jgi:peroxiredoxin